MVEDHPDCFTAFATLSATAPDAAVAGLERAVGELGFVGAEQGEYSLRRSKLCISTALPVQEAPRPA
ncbi:hypothetical protein [Amycolatopsis sp. NPDC003676]